MSPISGSSTDLFISYPWGAVEPSTGARPLQARSLACAALLREAGFSLWLDVERMAHGATGGAGGTPAAMSAGIRGASAVVCFIADEYARSRNCRLEAEYARMRGKPMYYVNIGAPGWTPSGYADEDAEAVSWLEVLIMTDLWFDARDLQRMAAQVSELIGALAANPKISRAGALAIGASVSESSSGGKERSGGSGVAGVAHAPASAVAAHASLTASAAAPAASTATAAAAATALAPASPGVTPLPWYAPSLPPCTWRVMPQFATWEVDHRRFELKRQLGKGTSGAVAEAIDHLTVPPSRVAIKRIDNVFDKFENAKRVFREVSILRRMEHVNIVKMLHFEAPRDLLNFSAVYIVFECMDTDVQKLNEDETQCLTLQHVRHFLYQTLCGMNYVHSARVLHRDIKPANLLLTEACNLKICDFGLSRSMHDDLEDDAARDQIGVAVPKTAMSTLSVAASTSVDETSTQSLASRTMTKHVVTRLYRAPEIPLYNDGVYSEAIDIWSVGCVFAEMLGMLDTGDEEQRYDRKALFPSGVSVIVCQDRLPDSKSKRDQLLVILDVLGTPSDDELRRLRNDDARAYIRGLRPHPRAPENLGRRFPTAGPEAIDLLCRFLRLLPEDRITLSDAIQHPFLGSVRDPAQEKLRGEPIAMRSVTPETIRAAFVEEMRFFNPHIPADWAMRGAT